MNIPLRVPLHRSAGSKIAVCMLGAFALSAVSVDLVLKQAFERLAAESVASEVEANLKLVGASLAHQVAFDQRASAERTLKRVVEDLDQAISRAIIIDAAGQPYVSWGEDISDLQGAAASGPKADGARTVVARLEVPSGMEVGAVAVEWTPPEITEKWGSIQRRVILTITAIGLTATALVLIVFRYMVSKPLYIVTAAVERLFHHDYDSKVPPNKRRDEIGVLGRSVESFRVRLGETAKPQARAQEIAAAFEATSAPLIVADSDGLIREINMAAHRLLSMHQKEAIKIVPGVDLTQVMGQSLQRVHHFEGADSPENKNASSMSALVQFGAAQLKLQTQPLRAVDEEVIGFVVELQDVTEDFRNSSSLHAIDRTHLRAEFAEDGVLIACNEWFRDAVGDNSGNFADLLRSAEQNGPSGAEILKRASRGESIQGQFEIFLGSANAAVVEGCISAMLGSRGTGNRIHLVARDITETHADVEQARIEFEHYETGRNRALDALRVGIRALSQGDLDAEIEIPFEEAFEDLRRDFNVTVQMLQSTILEASERIDAIRTHTAGFNTTAKILSQEDETASAALQKTAEILDALSRGVASAAESARQSSSSITNACKIAEHSGQAVARAVRAIDEITVSSTKVASVVKVIDDIAYQTNLLALNAGVEAARAGDAGRGFAVVASEVRALAQRSSDAASKINMLIDQSSSQVASGVALVREAGRALHELNGQVISMSEILLSTEAANSHFSKLQAISESIIQVTGVAQRNAPRLEDAATACDVLLLDASALEHVIAQLRLPNAKESRGGPLTSNGRDGSSTPVVKSITTASPITSTAAILANS